MNYVLTNLTKGLLTVTLNREHVHNSFDDQFILELTETFEQIDLDQVKLILLTGIGKSFCAGADLTWMKKMVGYSYEENIQDASILANLFKTMDGLKVPLIGKINGSALGGGVGLVALCDIAIAAENAKFGFTEVRLGLIPSIISPYVMKKISLPAAYRYFLTGEIFSATTAQALGLVSDVVPHETLDSFVAQLMDQLMMNSPDALLSAKSLIKKVSGSMSEELIGETISAIAKIRTSKNGQEGMNAFLEKRKPQWQ